MLLEWLESLAPETQHNRQCLPSAVEFVRNAMSVMERMTQEVATMDGAAASMEETPASRLQLLAGCCA